MHSSDQKIILAPDNLIKWSLMGCILVSGVTPGFSYNLIILCGFFAIFFKRWSWEKHHTLLLGFTIWSIFCTLIQSEYTHKLSSTQLLFVHLWLPLLVAPAINWTRKDAKIVTVTLFIAVGYMSIIGIGQSLLGADHKAPPLYMSDGPLGLRGIASNERLPNVWSHTSDYGYAISLIFIFLAAHLNSTVKSTKAGIAALGLWALHFLLHRNRGGLLGILTTIPLIFTKNWTVKTLVKVYGILAAFSIPALIVVCLAIPSFGERMQRSLRLDDGRVPVWKSAIYLIEQEPVFGYGGKKNSRKAYESVPAEIQGPEFINKGYGTNAHNNVLSIGVSYGIFGAILWSIGQVALLIYLYRHRVQCGFALLVGYHVVGLVHHASEDRPISTLVFTLIGISIALHKSKAVEQEQAQEPLSDTRNTA